jgi:hypothetical protein
MLLINLTNCSQLLELAIICCSAANTNHTLLTLLLPPLLPPTATDPPDPEMRPQTVVAAPNDRMARLNHAGLWQACYADLDEARLAAGSTARDIVFGGGRSMASCCVRRALLCQPQPWLGHAMLLCCVPMLICSCDGCHSWHVQGEAGSYFSRLVCSVVSPAASVLLCTSCTPMC